MATDMSIRGQVNVRKHRTSETAALAERWAGEVCTLNGAPATVQGSGMRFAWVRVVHGLGGAEFAWETVARIMANGGHFKA